MTFNILAHLAKAEIGKMWFVRVSNDDASLLHFNAIIFRSGPYLVIQTVGGVSDAIRVISWWPLACTASQTSLGSHSWDLTTVGKKWAQLGSEEKLTHWPSTLGRNSAYRFITCQFQFASFMTCGLHWFLWAWHGASLPSWAHLVMWCAVMHWWPCYNTGDHWYPPLCAAHTRLSPECPGPRCPHSPA